MKVLKNGIQNDVFIGKCPACRTIFQCIRKDFKDRKKAFPFFDCHPAPASVFIECSECGNPTLNMVSKENSNWNTLAEESGIITAVVG